MSDKYPNITRLVKELRALKDQKDDLEEQLKVINKRAKELQERLLPHEMEQAELENFKVTGAGTCYVKQELYVSMTPAEAGGEEVEPPFYAWAREHAPDLIKPFIHPQRLKAWAKDRLENGLPVPSNTLKAKFVPTATLLRR